MTGRLCTAAVAMLFLGLLSLLGPHHHDLPAVGVAEPVPPAQGATSHPELSRTPRSSHNDTAAESRRLLSERRRPAPTPASRSTVRPALPDPPSAARGGALFDVTAYCATGNRTASGKWPATGMVATLDRGIPFGTRVRIDTLGSFVVEDRIGWGSDFDVFLGGSDCEHRAAVFGRRHLRVEIAR